jgi:hypothetical protein
MQANIRYLALREIEDSKSRYGHLCKQQEKWHGAYSFSWLKDCADV